MKYASLGAVILAASAFVPRSATAVASAELYRTQSYVYGRFEARIRYAPGDGVISSFFLWKEGSEAANAYWNELDFEKLAGDCHMQTNAIYGNPPAQQSQTNAMPGDICAEYHEYQFEWTPTYIAWAVDGKEIRRETGAVAEAFSQNAKSGMTFHFNIWPGTADFGGNFSPSILPVRQYISWVQYSAYTNGSFKLDWREDFDGGALPSGWATGNWESPKGLSTHHAANVTFANGIAVLSLTADNATGSPGTPPADNAGSGGKTSAGTGNGGTSSGNSANRGGTSSMGGTSSGMGGVATSAGGTSTGHTSGVNRGGASFHTTSTATGGNASTTVTDAASRGGTGNSARATSSFAAGGNSTAASSTASRRTSPANGGASTSSVGGDELNTARGGMSTLTRDSAGQTSPSPATSTAAASSAADTPGNAGCSCRVTGTSGATSSAAVLVLFGLMVRRRRRNERCCPSWGQPRT